MTNLVVGLYDRFEDAQAAIRDLVDHGFTRDDISLVANDAQGKFQKLTGKEAETTNQGDMGKGAEKGAGIGAVIGGLGGLLAGLGALAIPGIGPVLAAGPIVGLLAGGAGGAVIGGLIGALIKAGIPEEQAHQYAEGVRRGGILVMARVPQEQDQQAVDILNLHNPVDVEQRARQWQGQNWKGFNEKAQPLTPSEINLERQNNERILDQGGETTIPVVEEELRVGKREVDTGGVRVHTYATEKPVDETVNLHKETVNVERRPVDRPATDKDMSAFQEGTMEVTEHSEEAVVDKKAHVVEEVTVNKDVEEHLETIHDTVRRTNVDVENLPTNREGMRQSQIGNAAGFDEFEPMFKNHFQTNYAGTNFTYDQFRPYYEYGYNLRRQDQFRNKDWQDIEPVARRMWEQTNPNYDWADYQDVVYQGWQAGQP